MRTAIVGVASAAALVAAQPASAQNEAVLRSYFEGKRVAVKIDMPGTAEGVDVYPDASRPLDFNRYGQKLKHYGTAIRAGDSSMVTLVKVKKDLIEFQLGGGGFGTFGHDSSPSVYIPSVQKSNREKDLEQRVKDERDAQRKRELQRELDDVRRVRERENRRIDAERSAAEELKKRRIAEQRLRGGSRFNLRYREGVPTGIKPDEVMAALSEWVDFSSPEARAGAATAGGDTLPRKGMSRDEAERQFGKPVDVSTKDQGGLKLTTIVFVRGEQKITCEFVDDVLIRYTVASK